MEELQQEKARFRALYYGQRVFSTDPNNKKRLFKLIKPYILKGWLVLTPLSLISDEDAIKLGWQSSLEFKEMSALYRNGIFKIEEYQYLLQNSYAIDWYSSALGRVIKVEEQVSLGWVKLKTEI